MLTLKKLRLLEGDTQAGCAAKVGISPGLLREIEAGRAIPSPRVANLLEQAFGKPTTALLRPAKRRMKVNA